MLQGEKLPRIYLSVPHMGGEEKDFVDQAFASNWLSTVGPNLNAFEKEFSDYVGMPSVALSSGTAAIHLALRLLGVGPNDHVLCSTLTFAASANPIRYLGAEPIFIDSDRSWTIDPNLLEDALRATSRSGNSPRAVIVVDLYGQCCDYEPILQLCSKYGVPVLEDAAEALGASYGSRLAGTFGHVGVFSFNGNKIITTTGGGMLVSNNKAWVEKARFWSQQARDEGLAYKHSEIGYNYRMSNVLAGIGRGQLKVLDLRVRQRRQIAKRYGLAFADLTGIDIMPESFAGTANRWLSCFQIDQSQLGISRDDIIDVLAKENIESRPVWKPMHMQPLYRDCECFGGNVARSLFDNGICLPSSSSLSAADQLRVINAIRRRIAVRELLEFPNCSENLTAETRR